MTSSSETTDEEKEEDIDLDWLEYFYCTILKRDEYDFWTSDLRKVFSQIDIYNKMHEEQAERRKKSEEEARLKKEGKEKNTFKVLD